ncbi:MAG TPA: peptidoglycan-binding domain-containing protein, partial [Steroidobacteraceae bacterium]
VSGGVPRVINIVCDRALLGAYTQELHQVPGSLVRRAGAEVFGHELLPAWIPLAAAALALVVLGGSALLLWRYAPGLPHLFRARTHIASAPVQVAIKGTPAAPTASSTPAAPVTAAPAPAAPEAATAAGAAAAAPPTPAAPAAASTPATTTAPPAPAPAPAPPTLTQWLTANHEQTNSDTAFQALFALWNASYVPGKIDGCSQALSQGLRCLVQRGSFAQLRLLNRPAILMLSDDSGVASQVVLRGLHEDAAQLQIGSQTATVGVAELARYWFGDFVLLWRPGTRDVRDLSQGMRGAQVRRLRQQLGRWRGTEGGAATASDEFDDDLLQLVEQFQRANRLTVDGVAGIETQVALDAALASPDSPLLDPHTAAVAIRGT